MPVVPGSQFSRNDMFVSSICSILQESFPVETKIRKQFFTFDEKHDGAIEWVLEKNGPSGLSVSVGIHKKTGNYRFGQDGWVTEVKETDRDNNVLDGMLFTVSIALFLFWGVKIFRQSNEQFKNDFLYKVATYFKS